MSVGKFKRYGLTFLNVAASNTATANITPGRSLESYRLKLGGTFTKSQIGLIKMKVNARPVMEITGDQLDKINTYKGKVASANFLDVDTADFALNNEFDRHVGTWDTSSGIDNITAEVTLTAGPVSPTLVPILIESGSQKSVDGENAPYAGIMSKILRVPFNIATGGNLNMTLPIGASGAILKRMHFFHGGNMTGCTIKQNGLPIHETIAAENVYDLTALGKVPQANMYTIDFVADGSVAKALDTRNAQSLEIIPAFSALDSGTLVCEWLDVLGNL